MATATAAPWLTERSVVSCLRAAGAAPSIHNTQPWRFRIRDGGFDVLTDPDRALDVIDPDRRAMYLSVGAAVLNLRLALAASGWSPMPAITPPDAVARIEVRGRRVPGPAVLALAGAVFRRRTNRWPYAGAVVPASTMDELRTAAAVDGVELTALDPVRRTAVLALTWTAETRQRADLGYRRELRAWTSADRERADGVPLRAFGPRGTTSSVTVRDFGVGLPEADREPARFESHPQLVLLRSRRDDVAAWLRTGQALQRVLLTATARGVATQPMTQALELPDLRWSLADPEGGWWPQMILRIGYGRPVAPSPRRRPADLVVRHQRVG